MGALQWSGLAGALRSGDRVDRIELKVLLDAPLEKASALLPGRVHAPLLRTVHFLDTADLALARSGVIVRVRVTGGARRRRADVVVKVCGPGPWRKGLPVELDALPGMLRFSASLSRRCRPEAVVAALVAARPAARLLGRAQRKIVRAVARRAGTDLGELVAWGPVAAERVSTAGRAPRIAVERWRFPDGTAAVELSAKGPPGRSGQLIRVLSRLITDGRVRPSRLQATKTGLAFQAFRACADLRTAG